MSRFMVSFERKAARRLELLSKDRSKVEVIREALALETLFQQAIDEGGTFILRDSAGIEREIVR